MLDLNLASTRQDDTPAADLERYLTALFAGCAGFVEFRGLGEPNKKIAPIRVWSPIGPGLAAAAAGFIQRCDRTGHAAYVIPATFAESGEGKKDDVRQVPAIVADLDSGDVAAKFACAVEALGPPTMVVESGGTTAEGQIKLHLYWRLAEPAMGDRLAEVQELRKQLAIAIGSDRSLQRIAQPIRLPTSTHRKDPANPRPVILTVCAANSYPFAAMHAAITAMSPAPAEATGGIDLNQYRQGPSTAELRVGHVGTEGKSGITRWEALSQVIGSELANARAGLRTVSDAQSVVKGWVKTCLEKPADWDDERVEYEFNRLLNIDVKKYGAFQALPVQPFGALPPARRLGLRESTGERFAGDPPPRRWLVDGSLPLGVPALLAAHGGLGKSMLALDLALRVVADPPPAGSIDLNTGIFGGAVVAHGTAVVLTTEDDADEITRRLAGIDPARSWMRNASRLIVKPLLSDGGPLVLVTEQQRAPVATPEFYTLRDELREIPDLRLVVLDPIASFFHADINADPRAGAFVGTLLGQLATETGATVLGLHHNAKGRTGRDAVRGTSALVDGVRWVYSMWAPTDQDEMARAGSEARKRGFRATPDNFAFGQVVKANGPHPSGVQMYTRGVGGLLRQLAEIARADRPEREEMLELLLLDIEWAAKQGQPFTKSGTKNGIHAHKEFLSEPLRGKGATRNMLWSLLDELVEQGKVVPAAHGAEKGQGWLDVPAGEFAKGHGEFIPGARQRRPGA
jgi:hypothetical protein